MRHLALRLLTLMSTGLLAGPELWGQEEANREAVALAEGVQRTKVSLIRGLSASARHGESMAATCALQHGMLPLSVCTIGPRRQSRRMAVPDLR
jgi:hypothetical protein